MWRLRTGVFLGFLLSIALPVYASSPFEQVVNQVIAGFQQRDNSKINSLIHRDIGLYVMYRPGVMDTYNRTERLDFNAPIPGYLPYESPSRNALKRYNKVTRYNITPRFDCDKERWNMTGLFVGRTGENHLLSESAKWLKKYEIPDLPDKDIAAMKRVESVSRRVVLIADDDSSLVFHLSHIRGKWYLTLLDRLSDDCSA